MEKEKKNELWIRLLPYDSSIKVYMYIIIMNFNFKSFTLLPILATGPFSLIGYVNLGLLCLMVA